MTFRIFPRFAAFLAALLVLACPTARAQTTIHVPADQPTIQAGINAANTGDTVLVAPGTYFEHLTISGKEITLRSSGGPEVTVLDGLEKGNVIEVDHTPTTATTITGFTIRNGYEPNSNSSAINTMFAGLTVTNNIFTANYYAAYVTFGSVNFSNNVVYGTYPDRDCHFENAGIGVFIFGISATLDSGGKVAPSIISNNTFSGPNLTALQCSNGAIVADNGSPLFITNNSFTKWMEPIWLLPSRYGVVIIAQNVFINNLEGSMFIDHAINYPPADPADVFVLSNTLRNNLLGVTGRDGESGPAEINISGTYSQIAIENNIISTTSSTNPIIDCQELPPSATNPMTPIILDHNLFWNPTGDLGWDGCPVATGSFGNINADPAFVSATDSHLSAASPAIDTGNNSDVFSQFDFDGQPRIQNAGHNSMATIDMGAYEFTGAAPSAYSTLALTASNYYLTFSNTITLTAVLQSASKSSSAVAIPSQPVTFYENGGNPVNVSTDGSGNATTPTYFLPTVGLYTFTAVYPGATSFAPAISAPVYVYVLNPSTQFATTTALSSSVNPSIVDQSVVFTATLTSPSGTPTGSIRFADGSLVIGSQPLNASGVATFSTGTLSVGNHPITASYLPTGSFATSSATLTQVVQSGYPTSITLTGSPNPSIIGQNVTFTATITSTNGTPTGSVQFTDNGTSIGTQTLNASGVATLSTSTLSVGNHNIIATYIPTGSFAGSSTSISQTVNDITDAITLTSSLNPSTYGQTVTITAHVVSNTGVVPTGDVRFSEGTQFLGMQTIDASGNASITLSALSVGAHVITGAFTPANTTHSFAGQLTQQVNGLATSTFLTAAPLTGVAHITAITLTATVAPATPGGPTPTGQVLFYVNGAQFNLATLVNGVATYAGPLPAGVDQIYAAYVGDPTGIYDSSNSNTVSVTITAAPSTLTLIGSPNPAPALTPFSIAAQLGTPSGFAPGAGYPITFTIAPATTVQSSSNTSGIATYTSAGLLPGRYLVTATFAGTTDLQPSTAISFIETVTANPTATALTASPNPGVQNNPVTFTSVVSALAGTASATGTITIYDSLSPSAAFTPIATLTLPSAAGTAPATFTTSALAPGTHILYAVFTAATGFVSSQSAQLTLVIEPQSFTLTLSDPTLTIQTGHHRTETVTLTSIGGLTGTFTLSCGTLPSYASCAWGQGPVTLPANGTVSTTLTVDTDQLLGFLASNTHPTPHADAPSTARFMQHEWVATTAFTLLPLTLLGLRRRRKLRSLLSLLLFAALASTLTACGANQYPYSTAPGTYTVHITATGSPTPGGVAPTQTVDLTLDVTR